jgi:hypothetical protein
LENPNSSIIQRTERQHLKITGAFPFNDSNMNFRFRKQIKVGPGLDITTSKGWPSLSIGGYGATIAVSRCGPRATIGIPKRRGGSPSGGPRHIHKAIQAQAEIKAVHAQGTAKAVEAQAYLIVITNRMVTVAKRLTKYALGRRSWKKAAIEQAQLLDEMLEVAMGSENDLLISAVRKCHDAWANDDPDVRAALNSGLTVTECLANQFASNQPDPNGSAHWYEAAFWQAVGKIVARNLILPAVGCGVIVGVYTIAARKPVPHPVVIVLATPTQEAAAATPTSPKAAEALAAEIPAAAPAPTAALEATAAATQHEPVIHDEAAREKHPARDSTHKRER